jgi:hypothetical protein
VKENAMTRETRFSLTVCVAIAALAAAFVPVRAADVVLSGTITAASGEAMGGVTVSAKADGQTITTTVFTDEAGSYYFPALAAGKYRVWAQALGFETAKGEIDLGAARRQDFTLKPMTDLERQVRQLPGDLALAGLPEETPDDLRMKRLVRNNCTGCHTPSYVLQHRFDEAGWNAIIELMKRVNVYGVVQPDRPVNGILDFHQKELAAYLARARGPGETAFRIKQRPRPSGETARAMIQEYDVPIDPDVGAPYNAVSNDGNDWSLGTPSGIMPGFGVHDAWFDRDGNLWFTSNVPTRHLTIGRIDTKSGAVKPFKVDAANGLAATTHGMTRGPDGIIWFNVNPGRGGLGRLDPTTEKIEVFIPPDGMSPTGGATTVDYDGTGKVWSSAPDGALRFDPATKTFTEFKSVTFKTPNGQRHHLWNGGRSQRQWLLGRDDHRHHRPRRRRHRQIIGDQVAAGAGRDGSGAVGRAQALRGRVLARLQHPVPMVARTAPHGHRQERRRAVGGKFVGRQPRPDRHEHPRLELRTAAGEPAALSGGGRPQPQRLDQSVDDRPGGALRPGRQGMGGVRPADARRRSALRLGRGARWAYAGGPALFPRPQGRGDDRAHGSRSRRPQGAGGPVAGSG